MNSIALIPSRKGSKGIPNKNVIELFDKPLIYWTIKKALQSKCFASVVVSTDCEEIANISRRYGASVPYIRPSALAGDLSTRNEVISDFFERFVSVQQLIYLQPTSPFRSVKSIKNFYSFINQDIEKPSLSLASVTKNPSTVLINNKNGSWKYIDKNFSMNRQANRSEVFKMDGSFFYINRNYWLKNKDTEYDFLRTSDTRFFINNADGNIGNLDIDDQSDLDFARKLSMN